MTRRNRPPYDRQHPTAGSSVAGMSTLLALAIIAALLYTILAH